MYEKMKVLIGYDGSDCAEAALDDLQRAGLPTRGMEAVAVSVAYAFMLPAHAFDLRDRRSAGRGASVRGRPAGRHAKNIQAMEEAQGVRTVRRGALA